MTYYRYGIYVDWFLQMAILIGLWVIFVLGIAWLFGAR